VLGLEVPSSLTSILSIDTTEVNQCGIVTMTMGLPDSDLDTYYSGVVNITWGNLKTPIEISFLSRPARAHLGIVTAFDTRNHYSTLTYYSQFYKMMCSEGVDITEIYEREKITETTLQQFDAIIVLDPFVSYFDENLLFPMNQEINTISDFVSNGGGLLVATYEANSTYFNEMFNWTGAILVDNEEYLLISNITSHPVTNGLEEDIRNNLWNYLPRLFNTTSAIWTHLIAGRPFWDETLFNTTLCAEIPGRVLFHGQSYWFENRYLMSEWHNSRDIVERMIKWVLGLI
jgi:hypothetical protein